MSDGITPLLFPFGGLHKSAEYQRQPPYTTPDCLNVWPRTPLKSRNRGGSRPGLDRYLTYLPTPTYPQEADAEVRMLASLSYQDSSGRSIFEDGFDGDALASEWSGASWLADTNLPTTYEYFAGKAASCGQNVTRGAIRAFPCVGGTHLNKLVEIYIVPWNGQHWGTYHIYADVNDATAPSTDGLDLSFTISGATGAYSGSIAVEYTGGGSASYALTSGSDGAALPGWLVLSRNGNTLTVWWRGKLILSQTITSTQLWGGRLGFGMACLNTAGARCLVDSFRVQYLNVQGRTSKSVPNTASVTNGSQDVTFSSGTVPTWCAGASFTCQGLTYTIKKVDSATKIILTTSFAGSTLAGQDYYIVKPIPGFRSRLIGAIGGYLHTEEYVGQWTVLSGGPHVTPTGLINSAERNQLLYIANHGEHHAIAGTSSSVALAGADQLDVADSTQNFTNSLLAAQEWVMVISAVSNPSDNGLLGTHRIATIPSGTVVRIYRPTAVATVTGSAITYSLVPAPLTYDPSDTSTPVKAHTAEYLTSPLGNGSYQNGQVPTGCPLVALKFDRIFYAGNPPHVWYASAINAPNNWDYGADPDDPARAMAGTGDLQGRIGAPITALMPGRGDYLFFGCVASIYVMRGDPGYGGQIDLLSDSIGVNGDGQGNAAWCLDQSGDLWFMSRDGIYVMGDGPRPVSRAALPADLSGIDARQYRILMGYDVANRGIHIWITPKLVEASSRKHFFFDVETNTFWPMSVPNDFQPTALHSYATNQGGETQLLLGCRDAYLRSLRNVHVTDEGTQIDSHVVIGPISLAGDYRRGSVKELIGVLAGGSGDVTADVQVAETAEDSVDAASSYSATWSAGRNNTDRPQRSGVAGCIKISGAEAKPWAMETILLGRKRRGRHRKNA